MSYSIHFDFDCQGEPPKVLIIDDNDGLDVLEVFEEPTMRNGDWSWEADDWETGPFAKRLLLLLNSAEAQT